MDDNRFQLARERRSPLDVNHERHEQQKATETHGTSGSFRERHRGDSVAIFLVKALASSEVEKWDNSAYVGAAVEAHLELVEESTQWQSPLFPFVRFIKSHPSWTDLPVRTAFQVTEDALLKLGKRTGRQNLPVLWERLLNVTHDDAEAEFLGAWDKIRYLAGSDALENAFQLASNRPLALPNALAEQRPEIYSQFVSVCGWLHVLNFGGNILLPVERLGELLTVSPMTVSRLRKWALEDRFLSHERAHVRGKLATEFRFIAQERFPVLSHQI